MRSKKYQLGEIPTMQVEINNQESILLPLLGHVIFGTDEECDVMLQNITDTPKKICSIIYDKTACILEVFNFHEVFVNNKSVVELAILHPGDTVHIAGQQLKIINENALPRNCTNSFKLINNNTQQDELITSVSGLRSFNSDSNGQLSIIGSQNSFTHKLQHENDIKFSVSYVKKELTLLCQKGSHVYINGNKANYAILKNGDYISTDYAKYCVESPGTSAFSKYSPSHPRNIQLTEEYLNKNNQDSKSPTTKHNNKLWWMTLIGSSVIIMTILFVIRNW